MGWFFVSFCGSGEGGMVDGIVSCWTVLCCVGLDINKASGLFLSMSLFGRVSFLVFGFFGGDEWEMGGR